MRGIQYFELFALFKKKIVNNQFFANFNEKNYSN